MHCLVLRITLVVSSSTEFSNSAYNLFSLVACKFADYSVAFLHICSFLKIYCQSCYSLSASLVLQRGMDFFFKIMLFN